MGSTRRISAASVAVAVLGFIYTLDSSRAAELDEHVAIANQITEQWVGAYNRRDAAALDRLYSSDAMLLPMGHLPIVADPDVRRRYFDEHMKHLPPANYKITRSELIVVGPKAMVQGGTWSADTPSQAGDEAANRTGTYLAVIAKQDDGNWKLIASTWNIVPLVIQLPAAVAAPEPPGVAKGASGSVPVPQSGTSTPNK
jgi:ketosteroid isomerase-like protein